MVRRYSKLNFVDAVEIITPNVYIDQDRNVSGLEVKLTDDIINSHLLSMTYVGSTLGISSLSNSNAFSGLDNIEGFGKFFVKQNDLTILTTNSFERKILRPLKKTISDFRTSGAWKTYVSQTLLPSIRLYNGSWDATGLLANTSSVYGITASATHEYLISNLSWLYFLNTSATNSSPSSLVVDAMVDRFYYGKPYGINDGIKDYQRYLWDNYTSLSAINPGFLPGKFLEGTGTYTSGNQGLEKLQTLVDVIYSPLYIDRDDITIKNAIEMYIGSSSKLKTTESAGPFHKFLKGISYSFRDIDNQIERLDTLASVEDCPEAYLPYLARLVGWNLYGNNAASWRNQIKNARRLYQKKGTKAGLVDAMNTVIVNNPLNVSSAITELYESYLPNIIYYLLKTESNTFKPGEYNYNSNLATELGIETFSAASDDENVRLVVDHIIRGAVQRFPYLFFVRNEPFRLDITDDGLAYFGPTVKLGSRWYTGSLQEGVGKQLAIKGDTDFSFTYRNRVFGIPPWEEEKFYRNCYLTQELLAYYKKQLAKFCVPSEIIDKSFRYVTEYTLSGSQKSDLYLGNGYVFFTSAQQLPPNYNKILRSSDWESFDLLSLWNGKSSTFDFTVCAGDFSSILFGNASGRHTANEIVDSLRIVEEFTPAKAIARTRMVLQATEYPSGIDAVCPSIRWPITDYPIGSGVLPNFEVSGLHDRLTGFANGNNFYDAAVWSNNRSFVDHSGVPVFKRHQSKYSNNIADSVVNTKLVVPLGIASVSSVDRKTLRRRNFYNVLNKSKWYTRDGFNMPSRYNNTSSVTTGTQASALTSLPLGLIPSSFSFAKATDKNVTGVYALECNTSGSNNSFFGLSVSNAYLNRGGEVIQYSGCDQYVRRDQLSDETYLLFRFNERKRRAIAERIVSLNYNVLSTSANWANLARGFANRLKDEDLDPFISPVLDIKSLGSPNGIQTIYNDYNKYFLSSTFGSSLPGSILTERPIGGPNIISHTYGPIFYNSDFSMDGSAVTASGQLVSTDTNIPYEINLARDYKTLQNVGVTKEFSTTTPYFGYPEYRAQNNILSGITLIDSSSTRGMPPENKFVIYNLAPNQVSRKGTDDNYLIGRQNIYMKYGNHGLPRIQYNLRPGGDSGNLRNIFIPEHDFELSLDYLTGVEGSRELGGGEFGVLIRTKVELTVGGDAVFFVWTPKSEWKMVKVSEVTNGDAGITAVYKKYSHIIKDSQTTNFEIDGKCSEESANSSVLRSVNKYHMRKAKIRFHTKNLLTSVPREYGTYYKSGAQSNVYNGRNVKLHRANLVAGGKSQNYFVEIFPRPKASSDKFLLVDRVQVQDKTLHAAARIPYSANIPNITKQLTDTNSTTFLLEDGSLPSFAGYFQPGTNYSFQPGAEQTADLFRRKAGSNYTRQMLTQVGGDGGDSYYGGGGFSRTAGADLINDFFTHGKTVPGIGIPEDTDMSILGADRGAGLGVLPSTGPTNHTMTCYGVGYAESFQGPTQSSYQLRNRNYFQKLTSYWQARKGFLSMNEWSPYPNYGQQEIGGTSDNATGQTQSIFTGAQTGHGDLGSHKGTFYGGNWYWKGTNTAGSFPELRMNKTMGQSFLALGGPSYSLNPYHSSNLGVDPYGQDVYSPSQRNIGNHATHQVNGITPYGVHPGSLVVQSSITGAEIQTRSHTTNPLGYSTLDDAIDTNTQDNYEGAPVGGAFGDDGDLWTPGHMGAVAQTVGQAMPLEFTSRRVFNFVQPYTNPTTPGTHSGWDQDGLAAAMTLSYASHGFAWRTLAADDSVNPHQPLKALITDPVGYIPSGMAYSHLMVQQMTPRDEIVEHGEQYWLPGQPIVDPIGGTTQPEDAPDFGKNATDAWFEEGHGLTFPPQSLYRDVPIEDLVDGQKYTFSIYVWQGYGTFRVIDNNGGADVFHVFERKNMNYATSAILTLSPIGSDTEYTRVTVKIPEALTYREDLGVPQGLGEIVCLPEGSSPSAMTIETLGHTLTGHDAATVETSSVLMGTESNLQDLRNWFRLNVTLPYNAASLDRTGQQNLGLRCTIQAYNDSYDGVAGQPDLDQSTPNQHVDGGSCAAQLVPCTLAAWGHTLVEGDRPPVFERQTAIISKTGREQILNPATDPASTPYHPGEVQAVIYTAGLEGGDSGGGGGGGGDPGGGGENDVTVYTLLKCDSAETLSAEDPTNILPVLGEVVKYLLLDGNQGCATVQAITQQPPVGNTIVSRHQSCALCIDPDSGGGAGGNDIITYAVQRCEEGNAVTFIDDALNLSPSIGETVWFHEANGNSCCGIVLELIMQSSVGGTLDEIFSTCNECLGIYGCQGGGEDYVPLYRIGELCAGQSTNGGGGWLGDSFGLSPVVGDVVEYDGLFGLVCGTISETTFGVNTTGKNILQIYPNCISCVFPDGGTDCLESTECPEGYHCDNGNCVENGDPGGGGGGPDCDDANPCPEGYHCDNGNCVEDDPGGGGGSVECTGGDCPPAQHCDPDLHICVPDDPDDGGGGGGGTGEDEEYNLPKKCILGDDNQLYIYNPITTKLSKLTVLIPPAKPNLLFKSHIYNKVLIYDSCGMNYTGPMNLDVDYTLRRPALNELEPYGDRLLTVSGVESGTNIVTKVEGTLPVYPKDLLHLFRYFNGLGKTKLGSGFNTRRAFESSGTHGTQGGSRVTYRTNPDHVTIGIKVANVECFTILRINN